jgi:hypothetical protein
MLYSSHIVSFPSNHNLGTTSIQASPSQNRTLTALSHEVMNSRIFVDQWPALMYHVHRCWCSVIVKWCHSFRLPSSIFSFTRTPCASLTTPYEPFCHQCNCVNHFPPHATFNSSQGYTRKEHTTTQGEKDVTREAPTGRVMYGAHTGYPINRNWLTFSQGSGMFQTWLHPGYCALGDDLCSSACHSYMVLR